MNYPAAFFAGAFLCNSLPHLISGLQGMPFPSPFAKPPGKGDSSPLVNFLWGSLNLLIGLLLLRHHPGPFGSWPGIAAFAAGFLALGIGCSLQFAKVRKDRL